VDHRAGGAPRLIRDAGCWRTAIVRSSGCPFAPAGNRFDAREAAQQPASMGKQSGDVKMEKRVIPTYSFPTRRSK